ncbi:hypothetical protein ACFLQU_05075 [Verrucomicrobiota bacterium]
MAASYEDIEREFQVLVRDAIHLSRETDGREVDSWHKQEASLVFNMSVMTSVAIYRLLPRPISFPELDLENRRIWDVSSMAILTRSLMESYSTFRYLISADRNGTAEERTFCELIWHLQAEVDRHKMMSGNKEHYGWDVA